MDKAFARHNIAPVYDENSKVLILGSFPSVKSREAAFFYAHPQNRFWRVLSAVLNEPLPVSVEEKRAMLLRHGIALWDVIGSCRIVGSADASIEQVQPNDLTKILAAANIRAVFCNGTAAGKYFAAFQQPALGREAVVLPSTSAANARCKLEDLTAVWCRALTPFL